MGQIPPSNITNALRLLAEAVATHQDENNTQHAERPDDSGKENDSLCPIFDVLYNNGGSSAILNMTNFTPEKVE